MNKIKVAINGCGRIGRAFLKLAIKNENIEIVAVNDLGSVENIAYLLKYDTAYGKSGLDVKIKNKLTANSSQPTAKDEDWSKLIIEEKEIKYFSEKDPRNLPWGDLDVDVVIEATGVFASYEKSQAHIDAGAKRVVITAPVKDSSQLTVDSKQQTMLDRDASLAKTNFAEQNSSRFTEGESSLRALERSGEASQSRNGDGEAVPDYSKIEGRTILMGVNDDELKMCKISSNASCTTNAGSPILEILRNTVGIEKAMLNTVHGYTSTQKIVDGPNEKDFRKGRAGAQNIIPSTTGAATATTKAIKELEGKFDGISMRVPVISGSLLDITFVAKKNTTVEEVNSILEKASKDVRWKDILSVTNEPIVSSDIVGSKYASIVDLQFTRVVDGNLVKVLAWYDNEMGYTNTLIKHVVAVGKIL